MKLSIDSVVTKMRIRKNSKKIFQRDLVYDILKYFPESKDNDFILYAHYVKIVRPDLTDVPFFKLFSNPDEYELPSYESVARAKRYFLKSGEIGSSSIVKSFDNTVKANSKTEKNNNQEGMKPVSEGQGFKIYSNN